MPAQPVQPGQYWDLLQRNEPPAKRRANHAKVRTGCTTCKTRRVKCDEKKPCCGRCEKSGYVCGGYEQPQPASSTSGISKRTPEPATAKPKFLQPRVVEAMQRFVVDLAMPPSLAPSYVEGRDAPFFERFRSQILVDISSWCGTHYWKHMLGEVIRNDCIRYAAFGLAAMLQAVERCSDPSSPSSDPLTQCREGQAALHYYMKAIALCREQLKGGVTKDMVRSHVTSTFFFVLIEILQGNMSAADQIMVNGTLLIQDASRAKDSSGGPALVWDEPLVDIKGGFEKLIVMWGLCPFFHGRRDAYSITRLGDESFEIPDKDTPVLTIRKCWNRFQIDLGEFMMSVRCGKVVSSDHMAMVVSQTSKFADQLRQWILLLDTLLEREKNSSVFYPLSTMKALALTAEIFLACFLDRSDVSYDLHLNKFLEIIQICQRFVPEKPPSHFKFTLDIEVFPTVSFVVTKCRDQKTRQLALKIFHEMTYRQVFWNNTGMLKSLQVLVDLEHKGRDKNGFIPPSSRYFFVGSEWDIERRQMSATFVSVVSVPSESGDMPTVRIPISYDVNGNHKVGSRAT
ncbi:hypothetical protein GGR54DRAFT_642046 [Hypoxylon sp. NC1633]|nr:hypothetical protein GGR54DRAFT_642046 [Hypoxylon sp. NC1633]